MGTDISEKYIEFILKQFVAVDKLSDKDIILDYRYMMDLMTN